ncbi:MAG: hypothetical protein JO065_13415, partial [Acidobacteria bacterium]|nr:hypothetical protein [Acidobacteriota bacterium]
MTRLFATLLCFSILGIAQQKPSIAPAHPVTDEYFGTRVADPYRYMENIDDPGTQRWMKEQNAYTRSVLARIPGRAQLLARIRELDQSVPQVEAWRLPGDIYFLLKALPGESTEKLYIRQGLNGEDRLVVDPQRITAAPEDQGKGI